MTAISDALNTLWAKVQQDDLKILLPVADGYLNNLVAAQGDPAVVITQSNALFANLQATGITMAKTDLADVAGALKTLMDAQAATLIPAPTSSSAATPAPAASPTPAT